MPGANDNLAAVAVLVELARLLRDEPPPGVRVLLLSTGSEESFMEGMRGFVARHAAALPRDRTRFVVLECVGGPEPIVLEGEGMLRMRDYTPAVRDWLAACGERAGHRLRRGLRSGFATDALIALKAGYPTGVLAAIDRYKMAPNYHSPARRRRERRPRHRRGDAPAVCLEAVRSLSRAGQLPRAPDRVLARGDRAGVAVLLELGEQLAEPRAGREAELARQLVAAHERRAAALARAARTRGRAARARARRARRSPASALRPRVASRSATVNTVTSGAYGSVACR